MKTKPKQQGTTFETAIVKCAQGWGHTARRLAEGASKDEGDIEIETPYGPLIIECKSRANLSVHETLSKVLAKASPKPAVIIWKRLTRKGDNQRRTTCGEPTVVIMSLDFFMERLTQYD